MSFYVEWIHRFLCNFMIWLFELVCCAFHWDDLDQDQWSEITQVIAHQGNWQIHPGKDSLLVHLVCYDPSDPYPDHPKWLHPMFTPRAYSRKSCNFFFIFAMFAFKITVSIILKITLWNYQLVARNCTCYYITGDGFKNLPLGPKSYMAFWGKVPWCWLSWKIWVHVCISSDDCLGT